MKKLMILFSALVLSIGMAFADYMCSVTGNVSTSGECVSDGSSKTIFKVTCQNHNNYAVNVTVPVTLVDEDGNPCQKTEYNKYIEAGKSITIQFKHTSKKKLDCDNCSIQAVSVVKCN